MIQRTYQPAPAGVVRQSAVIVRLFALALVVAPWTPTGAQGSAESVVAILKTCVELQNDFERLACYDKATEKLNGAEGTLGAVSAEDVFGMIKGGEPKPEAQPREQLQSITAAVSNIRTAADGTRLIELENGQIWRQSDGKQLRLESGESVTISRGVLGSFKLSTRRGQFVRVQRMQ